MANPTVRPPWPPGTPTLSRQGGGRVDIPVYITPSRPHSLSEERVGNGGQIEAVRPDPPSVRKPGRPKGVQSSKRTSKARKAADRAEDTPDRKIKPRRKLCNYPAFLAQVRLLTTNVQFGMKPTSPSFRQLPSAPAAPSITSRCPRHGTSVIIVKKDGRKAPPSNSGVLS